MKRKIINLFKVLAITAMAFTSNSCSDLFNDPLKDKETGEDINLLLVDLNFFDTKVTFKFEDYDTRELLTNRDISAALAGNNTDKFVSFFGEKKEEWKTSSGILEVYLDPAYNLTQPLQFQVFAYGSPSYLAAPTFVEISESGERTVIVRMINWESTKSASLKSASATAETPSIKVDYSDPDGLITKKTLNSTADFFGNILLDEYLLSYPEVINNYYNQTCNVGILFSCNLIPIQGTSSIELTATELTGIDPTNVISWGLQDRISLIGINIEAKNRTLISGESVYAGYTIDNTICTEGMTVKIICPDIPDDDLNSSSSFKFEFYGSSTLKGEISGTFNTLKTKGYKIAPVYNDPFNVFDESITLFGNSQYTLVGDETQNINGNPCGKVVTFEVKKKSNLVKYKFNTSYSCPSSPAALKYTGQGYIKNKTKNTGEEFFNLIAGAFTLDMIEGDQYELTVIIDSKAYSMNLDTNNILGATVSDSNISSFSILPGSEGENSYKVDFKLNNDDLCSKL